MKRWLLGSALVALVVGCDLGPVPPRAAPGPVSTYPSPQLMPSSDPAEIPVGGGPPVATGPSAKYSVRTSQLLEAAEKGRVSLLVDLVKQGADVNDKSDDGQTALHCAAAHGHKSAVVALLALGADMTERDGQGQTALMSAAASGNTEIVTLLSSPSAVAELAKGALAGLGDSLKLDLGGLGNRLSSTTYGVADLTDRQGRTALMLAAANGHVDCVKVLTEWTFATSRGKMNPVDKQGRNVLHVAAAAGHTHVVDTLLHKWSDDGPDLAYLNAVDAEGKTALDLATDHPQIVKLLEIERGVAAAAGGDVATLQTALERHPSAVSTTIALQRACRGGGVAAIKFLLDAATDAPSEQKLRLVGAVPEINDSLLTRALTSQHPKVINTLLDRAWWNDEAARKAFIDFAQPGSSAVLHNNWFKQNSPELLAIVEAARKQCEEPLKQE